MNEHINKIARIITEDPDIIEEGRWSKCPACGNGQAHQSFMGEWECPNAENQNDADPSDWQPCSNFSQRRYNEVNKPPEVKSSRQIVMAHPASGQIVTAEEAVGYAKSDYAVIAVFDDQEVPIADLTFEDGHWHHMDVPGKDPDAVKHPKYDEILKKLIAGSGGSSGGQFGKFASTTVKDSQEWWIDFFKTY